MASSDWLKRPQIVTLFAFSSAIMLTSGVILIGLGVSSYRGTLSVLETSTALRTLCGLVGLFAAPAGIYLVIGMPWYWAKLDPSPWPSKTLWFLLFLLTGFFGLAVYSLVVYRRQAAGRIIAGESQ